MLCRVVSHSTQLILSLTLSRVTVMVLDLKKRLTNACVWHEQEILRNSLKCNIQHKSMRRLLALTVSVCDCICPLAQYNTKARIRLT